MHWKKSRNAETSHSSESKIDSTSPKDAIIEKLEKGVWRSAILS